MFFKNLKITQRIDFLLLFNVLALSFYGFLVLNSAVLSLADYKQQSIIKTQSYATILGFIIVILLTVIPYSFWGKIYIPIYIFSNLLLIITLLFGEVSYGSKSWLKIGNSFTVQPSEFVKIGIIISVAKLIELNHKKLNSPLTFIKLFVLSILPIVLILLQPDKGTAIVFMIFIASMFYIGGISWKYILYIFGIFGLSIPLIWLRFDDYVKDRFLNFFNPARDTLNTGFQGNESIIAIGSGQVFGQGLFKGIATQNNFIPLKENDFIFSVIGEELGLIGGVILFILFAILLLRMLNISKKTDLFGSLMIVGFIGMFLSHIWENVGMTMGLMPITGIPLPFFSQGGTFQLSNFICIGIISSINFNSELLKKNKELSIEIQDF